MEHIKIKQTTLLSLIKITNLKPTKTEKEKVS